MTTIKVEDKIEDLSIKFLFIKEWKWHTAHENEQFQGHPHEGKVYLSRYNEKTKSYIILLEDKPFYVAGLKSTENTEGTFELIEIAKSNLLDLDLPETELDKIIKWQPLKIEMKQIPQNVMTALDQAQLDMVNDDTARIERAICAFQDLLEINYTQFDVMVEIAEWLYEANLMDHDDINDLALDPQHGSGVNISRANSFIAKYVSKDRRVNLNREDLFNAIEHLAKEIERRDINGLDK